MLRNRATLIIKTGKGILLAKHTFNFRYSLLGGGLKIGESKEECARREIKEETNLECIRMRYLFDLNYGLQRHKVFFAEVKGELKTNWEIRKIVYVSKENYMGFNLNGSSRRILERYFATKGF